MGGHLRLVLLLKREQMDADDGPVRLHWVHIPAVSHGP